eukprot:SM000191S05217  [mRNA]  locus=s191:95730:96611:+ [translate_table: standard]
MTTTSTGFIMGSGEAVDWARCGWTSLGTLLAAASANTLNQIIEAKNDAVMKRTMRRPLPTGRTSRLHALIFAVAVGAAGISILASEANNVTAMLGAANIALYALVYTPLKRLHVANTWVGAVVGGIPPLMGY